MKADHASNRPKRRGKFQALVVILGIIIAILLSLNLNWFDNKEVSLLPHEESDQLEEASPKVAGSGYTSASLFEVFTLNLPFLNNK